MWEYLGIAIGFMLIMEGLSYAVFPEDMQKALKLLLKMPADRLRLWGFVAAVIGTFIVWAVKGAAG